MQSGKLDRRVIIRRSIITQDSFNSPVATWGDLVRVWSAVNFVSDGERARAGEIGARQMIRFEIRNSAVTGTVDTRDRITFEDRDYDISGVKQIGRNNRLEITATARAENP